MNITKEDDRAAEEQIIRVTERTYNNFMKAGMDTSAVGWLKVNIEARTRKLRGDYCQWEQK